MGIFRHAQPLEMMLDAKAVRHAGIFAVDVGFWDVELVTLGAVRLLSPSLSTGFGIRFPVASSRF